MSPAMEVEIGRIRLKNPLIAGSAEHLIEADGVRAALRTGAGAVVVKSTNRSQAARDQLQRAEYMVLDADWRPAAWGPQAPAHAFIACRSGLTPQSFDAWLEQTIALDREAKALDAYAVASLIFDEIGSTVEMARAVEQAGVRVLELNIGTPYASQAAKGAVSTELDPARVTEIVASVRKAIAIPLWVKITGQSERVAELAHAAFQAGADAVVMAPAARAHSRSGHVCAHARHHARCWRGLEFASDLSLDRPFTRARWSAPAAHRHERGAVRVGHRAHDACRGLHGGDVVRGHAAGILSSLRDAVHICAVSAREEHERRRLDRPRCGQPQNIRGHADPIGATRSEERVCLWACLMSPDQPTTRHTSPNASALE
jgi:hypothetical protein